MIAGVDPYSVESIEKCQPIFKKLNYISDKSKYSIINKKDSHIMNIY